jgi:hypothetical protein
MKNTLKYLAGAVAAIALAFTLLNTTSSTSTAQPNPGTSLLGPSKAVGSGGNWTNRIALSTAITNNTKIDTRQGHYLALQAKGELNGAGTTTWTVYLGRNVDGSTNIEEFASMPITAAGTTAVNTNSIWDIGGIPYCFITRITNASGANFLTNYAVWWNIK